VISPPAASINKPDKKMSAPESLSPYSSATITSRAERHTLTVLVDNEPGVLARVVGLFSGRGYNIESLTVAEVAHVERWSRITIVTTGSPEAIEQISHQLERIVPIHKVTDLTVQGRILERDLALVKVAGRGDNRVEVLRLAQAFNAKVVDTTLESFVFELSGKPEKIDDFVELVRPLGLVELARTGIAALARGPGAS
jgi:acetolactate synthase-1/3 small subunit